MSAISLSTVIGDQIEKFAQPKNPIYRVDYIETYVKVPDDISEMNEGYCHELTTHYRSVLGELIPLNDKDHKTIAKFNELKAQQEDKVKKGANPYTLNLKGEWLDQISHYRIDTLDVHNYLELIRKEGTIHMKLFKYLEREMKVKPVITAQSCEECWANMDMTIHWSTTIIKVERVV
jgi:hypothetical protein